jgi:hypothetical protein
MKEWIIYYFRPLGSWSTYDFMPVDLVLIPVVYIMRVIFFPLYWGITFIKLEILKKKLEEG